MENKKETNGTLQRKIKNAVVFVEKTKETKSVYFKDRGMHLTVTEDYAVIETNFHRHVFNAVTSSGYSRPYLYTSMIIDTALGCSDKTQEGYSYQKMLEELHKRDNQAEYNNAVFFDWYAQSIFDPLYQIGENQADAFFVFESYIHTLSKNMMLIDSSDEEGNKDITAREFIEGICEKMREFGKNADEYIVLHKRSAEEKVSEEAAALSEIENEQTIDAKE